jgi:hypothetical protein
MTRRGKTVFQASAVTPAETSSSRVGGWAAAGASAPRCLADTEGMEDETIRDVLRAEAEGDRASSNDRYRRCLFEGCVTRLSRYNQGVFCAVHSAPDYRIRHNHR